MSVLGSAEMAGINANTLDRTLKPLDVDLPPTLPMNFGTDNSTVVHAQLGSIAHLPCVIHNIGDGVVTWIRRKKDQRELLTVGLQTYASDERFQARHFHHSEDWTLEIKYVQLRDAGLYECQVSTHPPTSIFLRLEVVEIPVLFLHRQKTLIFWLHMELHSSISSELVDNQWYNCYFWPLYLGRFKQ
ncbi:hypothetical protein TKK_0001734 [Trichogramma kaykai]